MRSIEKLLVWWVPLRLLGTLASSAVNVLGGLHLDFLRGSAATTSLYLLQYAFVILADVAIGIWLYHQAKRAGSRPWLWALAGFAGGIFVPALWIVTRLFATASVVDAPAAAASPAASSSTAPAAADGPA